MEMEGEYDFLNWVSWPSSLKMINESNERGPWKLLFSNLPVTQGATIRGMMAVKEVGAYEPIHPLCGLMLYTSPEPSPKPPEGFIWRTSTNTPLGTHDWMTVSTPKPVSIDHRFLHAYLVGPAGRPSAPMNAWFDDLKVYQDDVLIYANDFSKWDPVIGAGIGAGVLGAVVPAVVRVPEPGVAYEYQKPLLEKEPLWAAGLAGLGALIGGGIGLLTALGIVPVPQIPPLPTLEAPPEGARLGTYVVRG